MVRLPALRRLLYFSLFLTLVTFVLCPTASGTCYEPGDYYPPVQGTTHIESISPQVALPAITPVYIQGYCFGDTQGSGSVTLNGEVMTNIVFWTDAEIEFIPPNNAQSGTLVVTSSSYGSDSSANEAQCPGNIIGGQQWDYCGNDEINSVFVITTPIDPFYSTVDGVAWSPQYLSGTWYYDDGTQTVTLTLSQGTQNTDGTWPITGTEVTNFCSGQENVTGTLDQYGDFALDLPCGIGTTNCVEWLILGSGDVTSQGLEGSVVCTGSPPVPQQGFLNGGMDSAEDGYYHFAVPPLFKSQTDVPSSESVRAEGWYNVTYGLWQRELPPLNGFVAYAGRFIYEQSGGPATDGCFSGDPHSGVPLEVTSTVTGGGWYVDQDGTWGYDAIGDSSEADTYYQNYYGPMGQTCQITGPQELYINSRTGSVGTPGSIAYITDQQMPAEITPTQLYTGLAPDGGQMVTECEVYPKLKGKCR